MSKSPCSLVYPLAGQESKASERWRKTSQKAKGYAGISIVRSGLLIRWIGGKINIKNILKMRLNDSGQAMMQPGREETEGTSQELMVTGFNSYGYTGLVSSCHEEALSYIALSAKSRIWNVFSKWKQQQDSHFISVFFPYGRIFGGRQFSNSNMVELF